MNRLVIVDIVFTADVVKVVFLDFNGDSDEYCLTDGLPQSMVLHAISGYKFSMVFGCRRTV